MKKKKETNWFFKILSFLFFIFISLYIALESGYYESKIAKKTEMTEESVKRFEEDIKNGKPIDVDSYVFKEHKDYRNNTTDAAIFIGKKVEKLMSTGITDFFNLVKAFFT